MYSIWNKQNQTWLLLVCTYSPAMHCQRWRRFIEPGKTRTEGQSICSIIHLMLRKSTEQLSQKAQGHVHSGPWWARITFNKVCRSFSNCMCNIHTQNLRTGQNKSWKRKQKLKSSYILNTWRSESILRFGKLHGRQKTTALKYNVFWTLDGQKAFLDFKHCTAKKTDSTILNTWRSESILRFWTLHGRKKMTAQKYNIFWTLDGQK